MITILSTLASLLSFRVRSRASLELELIALRHQVIVLRRRRPRRLRLFFTDLLFWVWLYRLRPELLDTLIVGRKYRSGVDPEGLALTSRRRGALAGMMAAGGAGVAIAGLSHWGNLQTKGAANRGKPLSAPAVSGAAASASAASSERRRSALLDSGKSMVQRLA
jgi:hypothetical protein